MLSEPIRFRTLSGEPIEAPLEWRPALVELPGTLQDWQTVKLLRNGEPLSLFQQRLVGELRLLASWPLSGTGNYRLELLTGSEKTAQIVTVRPRKLSEEDYFRLLSDLQLRLPSAVALGLQKCGAFAGVEFLPPDESTYAEELARLKVAVVGNRKLPGLVQLLPGIAKDPHQALRNTESWVPRVSARYVDPARLAQAMARGGNLAEDHLPIQVLNTRVERTLDIYENQLLQVYRRETELRLRRLLSVRVSAIQAEAQVLLQQLARARLSAPFLDDVSLPMHLSTRPTLVLLKRSDYRAVLEGYLRLHQSMAVRLDTDSLDAPLENLPLLYQQWCTLEVLVALLEIVAVRGFIVHSSAIVHRDSTGFFVRILPNGYPAVVLTDPEHKRTVYLTPERTFTTTGALRSISSPQRPDITLGIEDALGRSQLYLFDPKYRLDSEIQQEGGNEPIGEPRKLDIDKMHAYRDAIRDASGASIVPFAAILYPGKTRSFPRTSTLSRLTTTPLAAISAVPTRSGELAGTLHNLLSQALDGSLD